MEKVYIIVIILLIGGGVFLYMDKNSEKSANNKTFGNLNTSWNTYQQKAIEIADQELIKYFPDKKNYGIEYKVTDVMGLEKPSNTLNQLYEVVYDLPMGPTDKSVKILVDITSGKVVRYAPHVE